MQIVEAELIYSGNSECVVSLFGKTQPRYCYPSRSLERLGQVALLV
jgi:hypothetical protein